MKLLIRFGIVFIMFGPFVIGSLVVNTQTNKWPNSERFDGRESKEATRCNDWRYPRVGGQLTTTSRWYDLQATRKLAQGREYFADNPGSFYPEDHPRDSLEWWRFTLEHRPDALQHDAKYIHLLGRIKYFLNSLDSAESGDILKTSPKQNPKDKSC